MLANGSEWPTELIQELNQFARVHKFDWEKVAIQLVETNLYDHVRPEITPTTCRMKFAQFNSVEVVKVEKENNNPTNEVSEGIVTTKSTSILTSYQNMSIEELMATVEHNEREMESKKEKIFQRVLDSLGEFELSAADSQRIIQADPAISAYREARLKKQEFERLQQLKQEEQLEKERLERERHALRRRFDPDSEDAVGEYPEFLSHSHHTEGTYVEGKTAEYKPLYHLQSQQEEGEAQFINSFSMQNFIHGEEFDRILSELEKELESQAMGKEFGEPTELGEVLQFLEQSVDQGKPHANHRLLKEEVDHSDHILAESRKLVEEYTQAMALLRPEPSVTPSSVSPLPTTTAAVPSSQKIEEERNPVKASTVEQVIPSNHTKPAGAGRMSYGQSNQSGPRSETSRKPKQPESESEDDDKDDDNDDDGNQSWRNKRNRMKVQAQRRVEQQKPHSNPVQPSLARESPTTETTTPVVSTLVPTTSAPVVDTQPKETDNPSEPSPSQVSVLPSENQEILKATELILEEIVPFIEVESVPNASGSLLSSANRQRKKK